MPFTVAIITDQYNIYTSIFSIKLRNKVPSIMSLIYIEMMNVSFEKITVEELNLNT